nr:unnamed protein product [Callosobruchus chinensis]
MIYDDFKILSAIFSDRPKRFPVIVYLHGESYEWNSGNAYDGSILAAYGNVVVVTLNFRLGILGFLKLAPHRANFGLIDQVAALVWIQENIAEFGGDPKQVTLMGHSTGAASASLLMLSDMATGDGTKDRLFHRAILMSGTSLADWAMAPNPDDTAQKALRELGCNSSHYDQEACLRGKSLNEMMRVAGLLATSFGPVIDTVVVTSDPKEAMRKKGDIFKKFELIYGVTEMDSIHALGPVSLIHGMLKKDRNQELKKYIQTRCEVLPESCLRTTLSEYGFYEKEKDLEDFSGMHQEPLRVRDGLLDILSDAWYVAPIVQTGKYHAMSNIQSYFYVYKYKTIAKDYIRGKSHNGEELPYVFGVPLGGLHFANNYTDQERLFSEIVMTYFCNFANTGNPNLPRKNKFKNMSPAYWYQFDVDWKEFDPPEEWYLELDIPPQSSQHYRSKEVKFWTSVFPKLEENHSYMSHHKNFLQVHATRKPFYLPPPPPPNKKNPLPWENFYSSTRRPIEMLGIYSGTSIPPRRSEVYGTIEDMGPERPENIVKTAYGTVLESPPQEVKQGSSANIIAIVGSIFLLLNVVVLFVILYFKCYRNKKGGEVKADEVTETTEGDKLQREEEAFLLNGCNIVKMMSRSSKSDDTYGAVKMENKQELTRQMSASTIDAHTKVRDWITQEIIQKYSPKFFRKTNNTKNKMTIPPDAFCLPLETEKNSTLGRSSTIPASPASECKRQVIEMKTSTITRPKIKAPKVSVGIDATPGARGPSVLAQQPIELTKSLDYPHLKPEMELPLRRSFTLEDFSSMTGDIRKELRKSSTSIDLLSYPETEPTVIKIEHHHSKSEPVEDLDYTLMRKMKTFDPNYVNVTSRDDDLPTPTPLTPQESLMTIKRRNYPKVLPDYPGRESVLNKRRSMPAHGLFLPIPESCSFSQPNSPGYRSFSKIPPTPPPRVSTLPRQSESLPLPSFISEPTLAEEPNEEPEIVCNNLFIGPLLPKSNSNSKDELVNSKGDLKCEPVYESLRSKPVTNPTTSVPVRRDPKVIVKPTVSKKPSDDKGKNIPRVVVPDNQPHLQHHIRDESGVCTREANKAMKRSHIPMLVKCSNSNLSKDSSSSDSTPSSEESDTGTIVRRP